MKRMKRKQIHKPDAIPLLDPRIDRDAPVTANLLPLNAFRHEPSVSFIKVYEPGNNRSTGDTVRFRDVQDEQFVVDLNQATGFTITVIDEDFYSVPSGGLAHSSPTIIGGGGQAFAGPVTLSA